MGLVFDQLDEQTDALVWHRQFWQVYAFRRQTESFHQLQQDFGIREGVYNAVSE